MGLPEVVIEFGAKSTSAIRRSENGIVALILTDARAETTSYTYRTMDDVNDDDWYINNRNYLSLAFKGSPNRVIVERVTETSDLDAALGRLKNKNWDWLAVPGIDTETDDTKNKIRDWIISQRDVLHKTFKAVLPSTAANHEGIVNFTTDNIVCDGATYTNAEFCARIAGLIAGTALDTSCTYSVLSDVSSITEIEDGDAAVDNGEFILINDGENIKVGRAVNSLTVTNGSTGKTEDMKSIKIIEGMDLIADDIRDSFIDNYIGMANSYDNKQLFIGAVNSYLDGLVTSGVLYDAGENYAEIDVAATKNWLSENGTDTTNMGEDEIRQANTGTYLFVAVTVTFQNAIEDLHVTIAMN